MSTKIAATLQDYKYELDPGALQSIQDYGYDPHTTEWEETNLPVPELLHKHLPHYTSPKQWYDDSEEVAYVNAMSKNPQKLPPILTTSDGEPIDGSHRLIAHYEAGLPTIRALRAIEPDWHELKSNTKTANISDDLTNLLAELAPLNQKLKADYDKKAYDPDEEMKHYTEPDSMLKQAEMVPVSVLRQLREFDRRPGDRHGTTPERYEALKSHIGQHGITSPVWLDWHQPSGTMHLSEGNHRLAAAEDLGITHLPAIVYTRSQQSPAAIPIKGGPQPDRYDYVPSYVKPSEFPALRPAGPWLNWQHQSAVMPIIQRGEIPAPTPNAAGMRQHGLINITNFEGREHINLPHNIHDHNDFYDERDDEIRPEHWDEGKLAMHPRGQEFRDGNEWGMDGLRAHLQHLASEHNIDHQIQYMWPDQTSKNNGAIAFPEGNKTYTGPINNIDDYLTTLHEDGHLVGGTPEVHGTHYGPHVDQDWNPLPGRKTLHEIDYMPSETGGWQKQPVYYDEDNPEELSPFNQHEAKLETEARAWEWAFQHSLAKVTPETARSAMTTGLASYADPTQVAHYSPTARNLFEQHGPKAGDDPWATQYMEEPGPYTTQLYPSHDTRGRKKMWDAYVEKLRAQKSHEEYGDEPLGREVSLRDLSEREQYERDNGIRYRMGAADMQGCMLALYPPDEVANELVVEGGESQERLHITVIYFEQSAAEMDDEENQKIEEIVSQIASNQAPLEVTIEKADTFPSNDEGQPFVGLVEAPGLPQLHDALAEELKKAGFAVSEKFDFNPHVTLKYLDNEEQPEVKLPQSFSVDSIEFVAGDQQLASFPLGSPGEAPAKLSEPQGVPTHATGWTASTIYSSLAPSEDQHEVKQYNQKGKHTHTIRRCRSCGCLFGLPAKSPSHDPCPTCGANPRHMAGRYAGPGGKEQSIADALGWRFKGNSKNNHRMYSWVDQLGNEHTVTGGGAHGFNANELMAQHTRQRMQQCMGGQCSHMGLAGIQKHSPQLDEPGTPVLRAGQEVQYGGSSWWVMDIDGNLAHIYNEKGEDIVPTTQLRVSNVPSMDDLSPHRYDSECYEVAHAVANQWPHLKEDSGYYVDPESGKTHDHGWNIAPDGTLVDMTAKQFDYLSPEDEEGWDEISPPTHPEIIPPGHPHYERYVSWTRHPERTQEIAHARGQHEGDPVDICPLCQRTAASKTKKEKNEELLEELKSEPDRPKRDPDFVFVYFQGKLEMEVWSKNVRYRKMADDLIKTMGFLGLGDYENKLDNDTTSAWVAGEVWKGTEPKFDIKQLADPELIDEAKDSVRKFLKGEKASHWEALAIW